MLNVLQSNFGEEPVFSTHGADSGDRSAAHDSPVYSFLDLDDDVIMKIILLLDETSVCRLTQCCQFLCTTIARGNVWRLLCERDYAGRRINFLSSNYQKTYITHYRAHMTAALRFELMQLNPLHAAQVLSYVRRGADLNSFAFGSPLLFQLVCRDFSRYTCRARILHKLIRQRLCSVNVSTCSGETPLMEACSRKPVCLNCVKVLVHASDMNRIDAYGRAALHHVAWFRDTRAMKLLIEAGADVHVRADGGRSPLHRAAWVENCDGIATLLAAGADPNVRDFDLRTPLFDVCHDGNVACANALLSGGASVNARDVRGMTPLHECVSGSAVSRMPKMVQLLLAYGADVNVRNSVGQTPADVLSKQHTRDHVIEDILKLLTLSVVSV